MSRELESAYPALRADWRECGGKALRLRPPGVRGIPDFVLLRVGSEPVFVEIKSGATDYERMKIDAIQIETLRDIVKHGGRALLMCWQYIGRRWALFAVSDLHAQLRFCDHPRRIIVCGNTALLAEGVQDVGGMGCGTDVV